MATKKLQILNSLIKQAENADTLDGKHADEFAAVSDVEALQTKVGDTAVSEQISDAIESSVADWDQTDETAPDYIKNKPDEADAIELVAEMGLVSPVAADDGSVYTDENGVLYSL